MSFCPFLSWPTSLPGSQSFPFPCSSLCAAYFIYLVIICWGLRCAPPLPLLSVPSLHCHLLLCCTLFFLTLCPDFSVLSTSFPLGTAQHIPLFHVVPPPPACSQVSAAVAAEVQDARRRPPAGLPLQASLPCGPLSPPWPSHRAMVPSLASRGPRSTRRYAFSWILTCLGVGGGWDRRILGPKRWCGCPRQSPRSMKGAMGVEGIEELLVESGFGEPGFKSWHHCYIT